MKGFLTARYMGETGKYFENAEVYRLEYNLRKDGVMILTDSLADESSYPSIEEFRKEWDMNNVPARYKAQNPNFGE